MIYHRLYDRGFLFMYKSILLSTAILLTACGGGNPSVDEGKPPQEPHVKEYSISTELLHENNSWFRLGFNYETSIGLVDKYEGNLSTYTNKHQPSVIDGYYTYSDNSNSGGLEIYLGNSYGKSILVHKFNNTYDPHQNASIQKVGEHIYVMISSRGHINKGYTYKVSWPNKELIQEHNIAYPNLWEYNGKLVYTYSHYEDNKRKLYSSCAGEIEGDHGHYAISYMDKDEVLHMVYNDHDKTPNRRKDLNYTYSEDGGCTWSEPVELLDSGKKLVYLKSLEVIDNKLQIMYTLSDTHKPLEGSKELYVYYDGEHTKVRDMKHNYDSGYTCGNILVVASGEGQYVEGNLYLYERNGSVWGLKQELVGKYAYPKKNQSQGCSGIVAGDGGVYSLEVNYE